MPSYTSFNLDGRMHTPHLILTDICIHIRTGQERTTLAKLPVFVNIELDLRTLVQVEQEKTALFESYTYECYSKNRRERRRREHRKNSITKCIQLCSFSLGKCVLICRLGEMLTCCATKACKGCQTVLSSWWITESVHSICHNLMRPFSLEVGLVLSCLGETLACCATKGLKGCQTYGHMSLKSALFERRLQGPVLSFLQHHGLNCSKQTPLSQSYSIRT